MRSPEDTPNGHPVTSAGLVAQGQTPPNWVSVKEDVAFTPRKIKIICAGAGFGGLTLAHKIKHGLKLEDVVNFVIYEKNADVGGTWFENRYPGVACDVPAHAYTFLFEPNPNYSRFYAPGPEIKEYIQRTARKWNLYDNIDLNSKVVEAIWDEAAGKWKVKVEQNGVIKEDEAEIFVSASGPLSKWKLPNIPGMNEFGGKLVHTAAWDESYEWKNKRVAVIGNGSSGIQCVTAMQSQVSKMVNYVRNPTWIASNFSGHLTRDGRNFAYTEEEKKQFREDPVAFFKMRKELENCVNQFAYGMMKGHTFNKLATQIATQQMQERLKNSHDPSIAPKMKPDFSPGCRRLTPCDGYLESFENPNTHMCWEAIECITQKGIKTVDGKEEEFDLIVCATGFDTSFVPRWKMSGRDNATLDERWKRNPEAFFSVQVDGMPNYFIIGGPNFTVSNGSLLAGISFVCDYIMRWAQHMATHDIKSMEVKKEAIDDYNVWAQEYFKRTAWADNCRSWYKNGKTSGQVTAPYAGTTSHFKKCLDSIGAENFNIQYNSANRFRCLGNGQVAGEENGMGDLSYYFVEGLW
ncbi:hypothetical protein BDV36DRAFT_295153 [Aspergillus pseudocaelatus]|uniref:Flavin-binding monooxygenase n=1 Tax=Aspergillus pseudocaelatus TaxID=1825620 RepID=A0ABQ6WN55_9EURO|nr:hypothetical protein BDV36DRAFT_295153 [Aspergillus pseudocaelatus]